jgi:hypothetical protein
MPPWTALQYISRCFLRAKDWTSARLIAALRGVLSGVSSEANG